MYLGTQLRYSGLAARIYQLSHLGGHTVSIYHLPHEEIAKLESSPNLTAIPRLPRAAQHRNGTAKEVAAFLETQLSLFCGLSAKVMTMCGLLFGFRKVSLCSPGCPGIWYVQAGLN